MEEFIKKSNVQYQPEPRTMQWKRDIRKSLTFLAKRIKTETNPDKVYRLSIIKTELQILNQQL